jgi:glycosyltransferase involved in cell wall biosynthesis
VIVGFDVSQTGASKAGCGYFADSLMRSLAAIDRDNQYVLYPTFGNGVWDAHWPRSTLQLAQPNVRRGIGHRSASELNEFWSNPPTDLERQLGNPDIIHANNFFCPVGVKRARVVYTLHDLGFLEQPAWSTEDNWLTCFSGVFNASTNADHVIAVSEYTRRHFLSLFPHYPADRVSVVHQASRFTQPPPARRPLALASLVPERFWLTVGTIEPRKNYGTLLSALARLRQQSPSADDVPALVIAGASGWHMPDFDAQIARLGLIEHVVRLGYIDDDALQWLYANCEVFIYPSLFEGFGLPVLEAMSQGAPVITSSVTSLPEVAGDAAILIEPSDVDSLVHALGSVASRSANLAHLRRQSQARAARFSWSATARAVLDVYASVLRRAPAWSAPANHAA